MKVALVTGANGFLGRHIIKEFACSGWEVVALGGSTPDAELLSLVRRYANYRLPDQRLTSLLTELRPTVCVHAAGQSSVPGSFSNPRLDFDCGPALVFYLLDHIRQCSPHTRFVFLSSAAVYGSPSHLPIHENHPLAPASPYGFHKQQSEAICEEFHQLYGITTSCLRIFSAYGPGLRRQVVWDLCRKLASGRDQLFQGTGQESRDFIHGLDVARATRLIASLPAPPTRTFNVATGKETTIADLALRVAALLPGAANPSFDGVVPVGTPTNWRAGIGPLTELGFHPTIPLDQGLRDFVSWFLREGSQPCIPLSA